jgi:galactose mutarotase-like enzyme
MAEIVSFGTMPDGTKVHKITLANDALSASFLTFGATLQSVYLNGDAQNLTLGLRHRPSGEPHWRRTRNVRRKRAEVRSIQRREHFAQRP